MIPPTPQMAKVLEAIRRLTVDGAPPSVTELACDLGYRSRSGLHNLLVEMQGRGLIDWEPGRARTLRILEARICRADLERLDDDALLAVITLATTIFRERGGRA